MNAKTTTWTAEIAALAVLVAAGCTGVIGDDGAPAGGTGDSTGAGQGPDALRSAPAQFRRLLAHQYTRSIKDLLGDAAAAAATPPKDSSLNGLESIAASQLALSQDDVTLYEKSARAVAAAALADPKTAAALITCKPASPSDAACLKEVVTRFGRLALRRPLAADELDAYVGIGQLAGDKLKDFQRGVEYAVATILESPSFLYRVELGDPNAAPASGQRWLTGYEMASRLSYFLADTTPTVDLLDAAEKGDLSTKDGVAKAARALVKDPAAKDSLRTFYAELFKLRGLEQLTKDPTVFPGFSPELAASMREETLRLVDDVVWTKNGSFLDVLDAPYTFVDGNLATLYGLPAPTDPASFVRVDLPKASGRAGLLGQAGLLSRLAHATTTSPTLRGKFVRESLLCQAIPAPPPNVNTNLPSGGPAKTMKEKLADHQKNPACASCHRMMDNIGLGLEHFDGVGAYRDLENGVPIDATTDAEGVGKFQGSAELGALLKQKPEVAACVVRSLFRNATGHLEANGEAHAIDVLVASFDDGGHHLQDLLVDLVQSDAFRQVGEPQ